MIRIFGIASESCVDGPDVRYVIFTQGCPFNCKECHNPASHDFDGGYPVKWETLYNDIKKNPLVGGVTFSGGEPFSQAEELIPLAMKLKSEGFNIWAYSGFTFERLMEDDTRRKLLSYIDVVVDGPFVVERKSMQLVFKGSSNQRIIDVQKSIKARTICLWSNH